VRHFWLVVILTFTGVGIVEAATQSKPDPTYWERHHQKCKREWPSKVAYKKVSRILHNYRPVTKQLGQRAWHYVMCVKTIHKTRSVRRHLMKLREWRKTYTPWWHIKWNKLPDVAKNWTKAVSWCESRNQRITTGRYLSYFQWNLSTWYSAGGDRHPYDAIWPHQAILAWNWHLGHPSGQWPNCGE
jgi:hypothetical protein